MWIIFGRRVGVKRVPDGNVIRMQCPDCGELAKFYECEEKESYAVFFVPFTADTERVYRCGACGASFDLVDTDGAEPIDEVPQLPPDERRRQELFAKVVAKRERERSRKAEVYSSETDRQLAELKKKLGR